MLCMFHANHICDYRFSHPCPQLPLIPKISLPYSRVIPSWLSSRYPLTFSIPHYLIFLIFVSDSLYIQIMVVFPFVFLRCPLLFQNAHSNSHKLFLPIFFLYCFLHPSGVSSIPLGTIANNSLCNLPPLLIFIPCACLSIYNFTLSCIPQPCSLPHAHLTSKVGDAEDGLHRGISPRRSNVAGVGGEAGVGEAKGKSVEELDHEEPPGIVEDREQNKPQAEDHKRSKVCVEVTEFLDKTTWNTFSKCYYCFRTRSRILFTYSTFSHCFFFFTFCFPYLQLFHTHPCPLTRNEEKGNLRQQTLDPQHKTFEYLEVRIVGVHEVLH